MTRRRPFLALGLGSVAAAVLIWCAGCQTPVPAARAGTAPPEPQSSSEPAAPSTTATSPAVSTPASRPATADAIRLAAVKVNEWPLSDFGMSVKTNFEVAQGENVQWMEVSGVEPDGPAAGARLSIGDRILAIDGTLVTTLTRDGLLDVLFKRKTGDRVRLLVARRNEALPQFVRLAARRP